MLATFDFGSRNGEDEKDDKEAGTFMNNETTMTVSAARVAANRRNAKKSTGPKSAQGKAVSRLNARKHRSLAETVLVCGREFREPAHEFTALCQEYYASLAPVGPLEEMLVDEIVQATWRLRRVRKAESGEIALGVDKNCQRRQDENPVARILSGHKPPLSGLLRPKLERSVAGCTYLHVCLRKLRAAVEAEGELTEAALADFDLSLGNDPDVLVSSLEALHEGLAAGRRSRSDNSLTESSGASSSQGPSRTGEKLEEKVRAAHKTEVVKLIEAEMIRLLYQEEECEKGERVEEQVRQSASILPGVTAMDRILRYEKGLERQLYGAMKQLERLQKGRKMDEVQAGRETTPRHEPKDGVTLALIPAV
jgi:hypothetical protein